MATISELVTRLTVDNAKFKKGMQDSENAVKGFSNKAKIGIAAVGALVAGSLVAGFRSLVNTVKESTERMSNLVDTATRLGAGIPELQKLQYAAAQSGISVESLNGSLGKMMRNAAEAASGTGPAVKAFERLKINAAEFINLGVDQQYIALSEAIKGVQSPAEQVAIAMQIFGRSGVEQLSLMKEDVRGLVSEFTGLGAALTGDQAKALESYGDSVSKMDAVWSGFKDQLSAALAGPLQEALEWVTQSVARMGGLGNVANIVANTIVNVAKSVGSFFLGVWTYTQKAIIAVEELLVLLLKVSQVGTLGLSNINLPGGLGGAGDKIQSLKADIQNRQALMPEKESSKVDVNITASEDFVIRIAESAENRAVVARETANQIAKAAASEQ